jgi:chorismate synthase
LKGRKSYYGILEGLDKMLRYLTAGESHGSCLIAIVEGVPAGLNLKSSLIDRELARRQVGYGRSERMKMEEDHVEILSGLRGYVTIGSPICILVPNRAGEKWYSSPPLTALRPGHADLAGSLKYDHKDLRNVLERSSARETAIRVAVGAIARTLIREVGIEVISHVTQIGPVRADSAMKIVQSRQGESKKILSKIDKSPLRCLDEGAAKKMKKKIDEAKRKGDTLGGTFEVIVTGIPPGLGSYVHWDRRLDGRLAQAVMSIQAIKGVEIGIGFSYANFSGSEVHDEITYRDCFRHKSNNAGGLEGGVTNGEPIILRAVMKPIPTLQKPLPSIDLITKKKVRASIQRSDVCAVPAAGVVAEGIVAIEIAKAFQEKFGGDTLREIKRNYKGFLNQVKKA